MKRRRSPPPLPPLAEWSRAFLAGRGAAAAWYRPGRDALGSEVVVVGRDHQEHAALLRDLRQARALLAVATLPEDPRCLLLLHSGGASLRWLLVLEEAPEAAARPGDVALLAGASEAAAPAPRPSRAEELANVESLFWIEAAMAARALEEFQGGTAWMLLERLESRVWSWIDVRRMEAELREGTFPRRPEVPQDRGDLRALATHLCEWLDFYEQLRTPLAREQRVPLDARLSPRARRLIRARLAALLAHRPLS